jgi:hypothetical protein
MFKFTMSLVFMMILGVSALAQDFPQGELFGGYSYNRSDGANFNGWGASITENVNSYFGIKGDFSGHYLTKSANGYKVENWLHTVAVGPQLSMRNSEAFSGFFHTLIGATNRRLKSTPAAAPESDSHTVFALIFGGGLDVRISKGVALRVLQVDYMLNRYQGETLNNFRFAAGFVYRFGYK